MSRPSKPKPEVAAAARDAKPLPKNVAEAITPVTADPAKATPQVAQDPTGAESAPAPVSAATAAEAASAPVDPQMPTGPGAAPEPANDPDGNPPSTSAPKPTARVLMVKGPAKGRWRAGRHFGPEAVEIPADDLSEAEIGLLEGDPELSCTWQA